MPSLLDTFAGEAIVPNKPTLGGDGGRLADTFLENRRSVVPIATDMLPNRHGPTKRCCRSATTIRGAGIQLSGGAWVRIVRAGMGDTNPQSSDPTELVSVARGLLHYVTRHFRCKRS